MAAVDPVRLDDLAHQVERAPHARQHQHRLQLRLGDLQLVQRREHPFEAADLLAPRLQIARVDGRAAGALAQQVAEEVQRVGDLVRHLGAEHAEREALVVARDVGLEAAHRLELREHLGVVQRHRAQAGDGLEQLEILARVQRGLVLGRQLQHAAQAALRAHRHQQVAAPVRLGGPHRGPLVHALVHARRAVRQPVEIRGRQHLGVLRRQPAHHRLLDRPTDVGDVALRREVVGELLQRRAEAGRRGEEQPGRDARAERRSAAISAIAAPTQGTTVAEAGSCSTARSASQAMIATTSAPVSTGTTNIRRVSTAAVASTLCRISA